MLSDDKKIQIIKENVDSLIELSEKSRHLRNIVLNGENAVEPVDLVSLLNNCVESLKEEYPDVEVHQQVTGERVVRAHNQIDTAIDELLENAVKHNDSKNPQIWISVQSDAEGTIDLDIADNGSGIPEVEREVVELGEEKPLFHSQGIGLWVVRAAIIESGGELRIIDNEPTGSIVRITLPKAAPA